MREEQYQRAYWSLKELIEKDYVCPIDLPSCRTCDHKDRHKFDKSHCEDKPFDCPDCEAIPIKRKDFIEAREMEI